MAIRTYQNIRSQAYDTIGRIRKNQNFLTDNSRIVALREFENILNNPKSTDEEIILAAMNQIHFVKQYGKFGFFSGLKGSSFIREMRKFVDEACTTLNEDMSIELKTKAEGIKKDEDRKQEAENAFKVQDDKRKQLEEKLSALFDKYHKVESVGLTWRSYMRTLGQGYEPGVSPHIMSVFRNGNTNPDIIEALDEYQQLVNDKSYKDYFKAQQTQDLVSDVKEKSQYTENTFASKFNSLN